ncbi:tRNA 2'-phosphotransferase 1-like [Pyrus ussuriensis x Pyrus communis]|uniref:2'-phosphotransferase n=1 Tax=Pyrus ussuriensis x Pyrus communis TaxID=2448454 RepID=A0A5N5HKL0_9ROSA|nr:tRNA 2'-phosphotransferase 1-like [Pyrus ussuriensis x Pyrus communis]
MDNNNRNVSSSSTSRSGGGGRDWEVKNHRETSRGRGGSGGGGSGKDKIDALGRLCKHYTSRSVNYLTRILRHMAGELSLNMRSDGYVKVNDLLKLNIKTFANIPLRSHTIDEIKEAVRKDNKQRFGLLEENGELLIRANQGQQQRLLTPILSSEEVPVCVHGTYRKNLESILDFLKVFSHSLVCNANVLIYLDVKKALEEGMKFYISENKVILTEGFDGVIPVKYFEKIESWPDRKPIPFST